MATLTISMPQSLKGFLEEEVATKGYGNTSEYVRELLRDAQKKAKSDRLDSLLLEGLTSGPGREWDAKSKADLRDAFNAVKRARSKVAK